MCEVRLGVLTCVAVLLAEGCVPVAPPEPPPTPLPPAEAALQRATARLRETQGYRLRIQATHFWQLEGKEQAWTFEGEALAAPPGRFASKMWGPADSLFIFVMEGDAFRCEDARGKVKECGSAFGGPGIAAAPYTVMAYLHRWERAAYLGAEVLQGDAVHHVSFQPDLGRVSGRDKAHREAMAHVSEVKGEAWLSQRDGTPLREEVTVQSRAKDSSPQRVRTVLEFLDFDRPVQFKGYDD